MMKTNRSHEIAHADHILSLCRQQNGALKRGFGRQMTPEQYKELIRRFGLTQQEAGTFFGRCRRSGQYWAAKGPPPMVAMLLRVMDMLKMPPEEVESILRHSSRPNSGLRQERDK
jgi:hypothetical protein